MPPCKYCNAKLLRWAWYEEPDEPVEYWYCLSCDKNGLGLQAIQVLPKRREGNTMTSFLDIGAELSNTREEIAVEGGEYLLRVTYVDMPDGKNYMLIRFELTDNPFAREVSKFFNLPGAGRDAKEENRNKLQILHFYQAFGIDPSGRYDVGAVAPEGFVGREGWALLGDPEDDGKGYGMQNRLKRFIAKR